MSNFKNAHKSHQHTHRERGQLASRMHLGLLEKKKDYKLRARDYQTKQQRLKQLRQKALDKNPDEFYFKMINSSLKDGEHQEVEKVDELTPEQMKLMQHQDINYIKHKLSTERKRIAKLKSDLHLLDVDGKPKNKHTFFVDTKKDVKRFDVAKHLETAPELLNRTYNIPRLGDLKCKNLSGSVDKKSLEIIAKERKKTYKELTKRIERESELSVIIQKMEVKKQLMEKKQKFTKVRDETKSSAAVYKWVQERKR